MQNIQVFKIVPVVVADATVSNKGYAAQCPELRGVTGYGFSHGDAQGDLVERIKSHMARLREEGRTAEALVFVRTEAVAKGRRLLLYRRFYSEWGGGSRDCRSGRMVTSGLRRAQSRWERWWRDFGDLISEGKDAILAAAQAEEDAERKLRHHQEPATVASQLAHAERELQALQAFRVFLLERQEQGKYPKHLDKLLDVLDHCEDTATAYLDSMQWDFGRLGILSSEAEMLLAGARQCVEEYPFTGLALELEERIPDPVVFEANWPLVKEFLAQWQR